jgi:hypothetical protein
MKRTNTPSRNLPPGQRYVGGPVDEKLWEEVKMRSIKERKTIATILSEALALWLKGDKVGALLGVRKR